MKIAASWSYKGHDACAEFFTHCLRAADLDIPQNAHVLEIGCAEFDWLTPASKAWPDMTFEGIDWRTKKAHSNPTVNRKGGDVMDPEQYAPSSFDFIVSISAIEHIGLGHYEHDPLNRDGDTIAIANAFTWLKVGGWLMFDVPYDPSRYYVKGTECRVYDDDALFQRLWSAPLVLTAKAERARGVADANPGRAKWAHTFYTEARDTSKLVEKPTAPSEPFHYVAICAQRVG